MNSEGVVDDCYCGIYEELELKLFTNSNIEVVYGVYKHIILNEVYVWVRKDSNIDYLGIDNELIQILFEPFDPDIDPGFNLGLDLDLNLDLNYDFDNINNNF